MRYVVRDIAELAGKTIERCADIGDMLVLTFLDGTCVAIHSVAYGDDYSIGVPELGDIGLWDKGGVHALTSIGVITLSEQSEWLAARKAADEKVKARRETNEREEYERLKAKFEGKS